MGTPSKDSLIFSVNQTLESLIQRIEPLTHKKGKDIDISQLLEEFYNTVIQSEMYLKNGVLTINFGKAAIFLDYAFSIYSKQVDLLWEMAIESERRFLSYEEDSAEKVVAEQKLEEKATKGKRGRKKKPTEVVKIPSDFKKFTAEMKECISRLRLLDDLVFEFDSLTDLPEVDETTQRRLERIRRMKSNLKKYPDKYIIRPFIETPFKVHFEEDDEECRYNNENIFANRIEVIFPEIERKMEYNYGEKRNLDTIGCDVGDNALTHYMIEKNLNPADLTTETYKLFQKYLRNYEIYGPQQAALLEQRKKLCPRRTSIMLTRLPEDVVQKYLKSDDFNSEVNNNDSGFIDEPPELDMSDVDPPVSQSTPAEQKKEEKCKEKRSAKRKPEGDDELGTPRRKVKKRSEIFKWLKTTTTTLTRFERFFCKTYLTEEGEGEIPDQEFSSDDEDNSSQNFVEVTTDLDATTSGDSGLGDSLNSSNLTIPGTQELTNQNLHETPTSETPASAEPPPREKSDWDLEQEALNEMQLRYFEWADYMRDELKKYTNRDFDIHEYGTKILNTFSSEEKNTVRFDEVCRTGDLESTSEIARFFAATLQLTNTENVQLSNWTEGELATDLHLTLLSRERHHEHLGDYIAPSSETVRKNVDKIKDLSMDKDDFLRKIESERRQYPDSSPGTSGQKRVRTYKRAKH